MILFRILKKKYKDIRIRKLYDNFTLIFIYTYGIFNNFSRYDKLFVRYIL